jgi:hypothetical protein
MEVAYGTVLPDAFMVRVAEPEPCNVAGTNPPLATPDGKPDSLSTVRLMVPLNPWIGVTVTV